MDLNDGRLRLEDGRHFHILIDPHTKEENKRTYSEGHGNGTILITPGTRLDKFVHKKPTFYRWHAIPTLITDCDGNEKTHWLWWMVLGKQVAENEYELVACFECPKPHQADFNFFQIDVWDHARKGYLITWRQTPHNVFVKWRQTPHNVFVKLPA